MVCATDNDCRIAQPNPYKTVVRATCDGSFFGGDLVISPGDGYFTAWSQGGAIRLEHFSAGASDTTIPDVGRASHPHLVSYGANRMLLAWGAGASMTAQVRDANTGVAIGPAFSIAVQDHRFQAFKAYADGSVSYPASGRDSKSIQIGRVMPCD
jgi:hypothetical protein